VAGAVAGQAVAGQTVAEQASRKRPIAGVGRVIGWPGGSVWIGRHMAPVQDHAHHAIQVSLAMEGRFRIRALDWPAPREVAGVVVMPDRRHALDGCGATVATLFVEPNSSRGAALRQRFAGHDVAVLDEDEAREAVRFLHAQYLAAAPDAVLAQYAQGAVCRIAGNPAAAPAEDPRITAALAWMQARLATPIRLEDVAAAVHLSPGRFRHLFVAQTGTSLRAWLLWARMEHAVETAFQGRSWTEAAHEAGFADAAHLTRTCRRVFGLAPTMLVPEQAAAH
jgi:AraC-like DNA-binding protein